MTEKPKIMRVAQDYISLFKKVLQLLRFSDLRLSIIVTLFTLVEAVITIAALYAIKVLIDVLTVQFEAEQASIDTGQIVLYLGFTGLVILCAAVLLTVGNYLRTKHGMLVGDYVDREIHARAVKVDLAFYESSKYFDSLSLARKGGAQRPASVVSGVLVMLRSAALLVAVLIMIAGVDWRLLPTILLAMCLALVVRLRFTRQLFDWYRNFIQLERRSSYLDDLMTSNIHAKEIRLGGLGAHLNDAYTVLRTRIRTEHLELERRRSVAETIVAILGVLIFAGATAFLISEKLAGNATVGDIVLFVLLFRRAETSGKEFIGHTTKLYDDRLYLGQLFDFLEVEPEINPPDAPAAMPQPIKQGLKFENVSFQYPGSSNPALEHIDLEIKPGQVVALVGTNGSGKTSLIKLLARLYDPTSGRITLDGQDVRSFDPNAYRAAFSIVFQDFSRYSDTVSDNIRFQDVDQEPSQENIERAARLAGADRFVGKLTHGYDTTLTRVFDGGEELSIGQWQQLALARAFYSESDFMILDEPSSALDPGFEFTLFENFPERLNGRGALLISHRLSTVRMADYTYVLHDGALVESGTHEDLIAKGGHYAGLFEKQGRNYR